MEKVKVKTCEKKETAKGVFFSIVLEDTRAGMSTTDLTDKIGQEIELDIKENKPYNNIMQYFFNVPKPVNQQQKGFAQKDWTYEKRKTSLECAIDAIKVSELQVKHEQIITLAETFYTYLNKK